MTVNEDIEDIEEFEKEARCSTCGSHMMGEKRFTIQIEKGPLNKRETEILAFVTYFSCFNCHWTSLSGKILKEDEITKEEFNNFFTKIHLSCALTALAET